MEAGECSTVCHQPGSQEEEFFAYQALIAYPVESMVTGIKNPAIFSEAQGSFPILVENNA
ncbi:hypothetical protein [Candidatus Nitrospira neomarina]|uniref:hypothetical protein n=1 Tax=Candidatus Nitrospira neomarina TaxID=3020899 RepID=UPI0035E3C542